ncbi:MAG: 5'-methylthioadenosine/adenosylhomocysteine nucleosidase [Erysipelotrichaceae bacterium]
MYAIIGAMQEEVDALKSLMSEIEEIKIRHVHFTKGILSNKEVVLMLSGVAKVNAAISTTLLFENFDIEGVINIGTAGGLRAEENELDVVVSTKVAHHDLIVPSWPLGFDQDKTAYQAEQRYIDLLKDIIEESKDRVWIGPIASGDIFVCEDAQVQQILKNFPEAYCAEMEAAAVAQVCAIYGKPFVVIRSLSDIAVKQGNRYSFEEYLKQASVRSATWCKLFLERV